MKISLFYFIWAVWNVIVHDNSSTDIKNQIIESVKEFFQFTLKEIPSSSFNLDKNFGVDNVTMKIALEEYKKDLGTFLDKGIELSIKESGNKDNKIEDAITFYPIKGVLQSLSNKIQEYYLGNPN